MQTTMFVFGSLYQGMVHHGLISNFITESKKASTQGSVYRLEVGYPVFSRDGNTSISGDLVTLSNFETLITLLDQFYGYSATQPDKSLHHRVQVQVVDELGQTALSWTYAINPKKLSKNAKLIENGDWIENFNSFPPFTMQLSERERTYISKLGQCTGRDIVPIQMDLYRSLINQGIIIDKGRRLALTKLGQEICRYLK